MIGFSSPKDRGKLPSLKLAIHGLYMGMIIPLSNLWDDPPSRNRFLVEMFSEKLLAMGQHMFARLVE